MRRSNRRGFPYDLRLLEDSVDTPVTVLKEESDFSRLNARFGRLKSPSDSHDGPNQGFLGSHRPSFENFSSTECLRNTLVGFSPGLLKSNRDNFTSAERYKLMYELCEIALILMATTSFCELCICSIQRHRLDATNILYEHYFKVNNLLHLHSMAWEPSP